jgi:hypothetical protein
MIAVGILFKIGSAGVESTVLLSFETAEFSF